MSALEILFISVQPVGEGGDLLPSALGTLPLPLPLPLSFSEGVVKGDFCSLLGSSLAGALGSNLLASWPEGGQFSVIISFGLGW